MSKVADSIRRGLEQAVADAKGGVVLRANRVHMPPPPRADSAGSTCAIRKHLDMGNKGTLHFSGENRKG